ncbi:hypothetical protein [Metabacillus fastidiosus]|nr:hypothetical protein [Metabacillus fastidiosus]MEC2074534.1 hypothetical protein [Metabacillus fastidiosus]
MDTTTVNVGDIIFQLILFGVPILIIVISLLFWRSTKRKENKL